MTSGVNSHRSRASVSNIRAESSDRSDIVTLDFSKRIFVGQELHIQSLREVSERSRSSATPQNIWVTGGSGTGKSYLVEHVFCEEPFFCSGKFDSCISGSSSRPYAALIDALSMLCGTFAAKKSNFKIKLESDQKAVLVAAIPNADKVIAPDQVLPSKVAECMLSWGFERLKTSILSFLKALCDQMEDEENIIFWIDDLHWADKDSLRMIQSIVKCVEEAALGSFVFVGSFRNNEVEANSMLAKIVASNDTEAQRSTVIPISDLNFGEINRLIYTLLDASQERCQSLTELVHSKTGGNGMIVMQLLRSLHRKKYIYFSVCSYQWEWDLEKIRMEDISENIVEHITTNMQELPETTQNVLKVASCFGSRVDLGVLSNFVHLGSQEQANEQLLLVTLKPAVDIGLIDINKTASRFKFSHNRCQQAAYEMICTERLRQTLHLQIGRKLLEDLPRRLSAQEHWYLLLTTDQLNRGCNLIETKIEKISLVELNLRAGRSAIQANACALALSFLRIGTALLDESSWSSNYQLTLDVSNELAKAQFINGDIDSCLKTIELIYLNSRSVDDKIDTQFIHCEALVGSQRLEETLVVVKKILRELGHPKLPNHPGLVHIVSGIMKVKRALPENDDAIFNAPEMTNRRLIAIQRHLTSLVPILYFLNQQELIPVITSRLMMMSLQHGTSQYTPLSLSLFAFSMTVSMDFALCNRLTRLATRMMIERFKEDARTGIVIYCVLGHIRTPLHQCLDNMMKIWKLAFATGDMLHAGKSVGLYCGTYYNCGLPLQPLFNDLENFHSHLLKYNQLLMEPILQVTKRCLETLMDKRTLESLNDGKGQTGSALSAMMNSFETMKVCFILDDLQNAVHHAKPIWPGHILKALTPYVCEYHCFSALVALDWWRQTNKSKYKRRFRERYNKIAKYTSKDYINCLHMKALLDAEKCVSKKGSKENEVRSAYDMAVANASRCGFTHYTAIANERAGKYCLSRGDSFWGEYYIGRAIQRYEDWGAVKKVKLMNKTYKFLDCRNPTSSCMLQRGNLKGRVRFDNDTT